ncbi:MAG: S1 RNA-binding domain-containing protein, partial [Pseudonocardiaceae bacterium]
DVVKPGDVVRVKVLDVDVPRNRIALTLRLDDPAEPTPPSGTPRTAAGKPPAAAPRKAATKRPPAPSKPAAGGALADALRRAGYDEQR